MLELKHRLFFYVALFVLAPSSNGRVAGAGAGDDSGKYNTLELNPFTPKASLIRYWKKQISNDLPMPSWFLNKASPLNPIQLATFSKLADQNSLSTNLSNFCKSANLLCFPDSFPTLDDHYPDNVEFSKYSEKNFTNYGTSGVNGLDSFQSYSEGSNLGANTFNRYSRDSAGHADNFSSYATSTNIGDQSFNGYGPTSLGSKGDFSSYNADTNVNNLRFTSYSDDGNGREQSFTSYSSDGNSGDQSFTSYGKNGNGANDGFNSYGNSSNTMNSGFSNYGETGNGNNDSFSSYGSNGNVPENTFKSYGDGGNAETVTFNNYRDDANVGNDSFKSYAKKSNSEEVEFTNYGSTNPGTDKFIGYGENSINQEVGFKIYGVDTTFAGYAEKGVSFSAYKNETSEGLDELAERSKKVNNKWVEPGKFFREKMLKEGIVMPMPGIKDKIPKRSFLPRVIAAKLPFSTSKLSELREIFHAGGDSSSMTSMIVDSLRECERAPSRGETKRCVLSPEDMIDFATSVLGHNVVVKTTENTQGSKGNIMIGSVKGINGGRVTKSVSCHQSLFPSLQYYCHSVPEVRVYEVDILDPELKSKINRGVAICHIDTSDWSSGHGAFAALGSGPGKIEVCHWIFENDMTWTISD